jgi:hypothetical protein
MHVVKTRATLLARRLHREPLLAAPRKRSILYEPARRVEQFEAETGIPIYDSMTDICNKLEGVAGNGWALFNRYMPSPEFTASSDARLD